jgi:autotransporter-associated beta strand protein
VVLPAEAQAAFNLTVSNNATVGVGSSTVASTTTFTATATGANVQISDLTNALNSGANVVVTAGSTGTEAGIIAIQAGISDPTATTALTFHEGSGAGNVGTIQLGGGMIATNGAQTFAGPIVLSADATLGGGAGAVDFTATVDGARALTVTTSGSTTFNGAAGGVNALTALLLSGTGATALNGSPGVATSGNQTFNGPVTLGADTTLTAGNITFNSTLDSTTSPGHALSVDTTGLTTFAGIVGGSDPLSSLTTSSRGTTSLSGPLTTSGDQTFNGPVTLAAATGLSSSVGDITLDSTVNGDFDLSVTSGGATIFNGVVGGQTRLHSLETSGGSTHLNGGAITTDCCQQYDSPTTLGANTTLTSAGGSDIIFVSTVDGAFSLNLNTAGPVTLDGAIGGTVPLTSFNSSGLGAMGLNAGAITTTGGQSFSGPITLGAATTLTSSGGGNIDLGSTVDGALSLATSTTGITTLGGLVGGSAALTSLTSRAAALDGGGVTTSGAQSYNGPVTLGANTTLTSSGSGNILFAASVDGAFALTYNDGGTAIFDGAVGGAAPLASITTSSSGSTTLNGTRLATTGPQTYNDPVTLGTGVTLSSGASIEIPSVVSGSGPLTKAGAGTLTLSALNGYTGGTSVEGGLISFASASNFGPGTVTLDGGGLQWAAGNSTDVSSRLAPIGSGGATFDTHGNDVSLASALSGSGGITKLGAGTLALPATNTYGGQTDIERGALQVSGTVAGPVAIEPTGALSCSGGTLSGGVTNNGGTVTGVPAAPSGVSATAENATATVGFTPGAANCFPVSYTAAASPGGTHASGAGSPIAVGFLSNGTAYTFTVTATNPIGSSAASSRSAAVTPQGGPPSARISAPASGRRFALGQLVRVSFSCADAAGSPGIASCRDSAGATAGAGHLDTSRTGTFTYTVTAVSSDGQTAAASITYTVLPSNRVSVGRLEIRRHRRGRRPPDGVVNFSVTVPGPGTIDVLETAWKDNFAAAAAVLQPAVHRFVFSRLHVVAGRAGTIRLRVRPNRRGQLLMKRHRYAVTIRLWVTYVPIHGIARSVGFYGIRLS